MTKVAIPSSHGNRLPPFGSAFARSRHASRNTSEVQSSAPAQSPVNRKQWLYTALPCSRNSTPKASSSPARMRARKPGSIPISTSHGHSGSRDVGHMEREGSRSLSPAVRAASHISSAASVAVHAIPELPAPPDSFWLKSVCWGGDAGTKDSHPQFCLLWMNSDTQLLSAPLELSVKLLVLGSRHRTSRRNTIKIRPCQA